MKLCIVIGREEDLFGFILALEIKLNGSWGEWDGWSSCSRTCGSDGTQSRNRACNDPPPENDGDQCVGPSTEVRPCGRWSCPGTY